jgi:hypothetical protein
LTQRIIQLRFGKNRSNKPTGRVGFVDERGQVYLPPVGMAPDAWMAGFVAVNS